MEISLLKEDLLKLKGKSNVKKVEILIDLAKDEPWKGKIPKADILISPRIKREISSPFLINLQGEYEKSGALIKFFEKRNRKIFEIKLEGIKIVGILSENGKLQESQPPAEIFILKGRLSFLKKLIRELEGKIFILILNQRERKRLAKEMEIKKENICQKFKIKSEELSKKSKEIVLLS